MVVKQLSKFMVPEIEQYLDDMILIIGVFSL